MAKIVKVLNIIYKTGLCLGGIGIFIYSLFCLPAHLNLSAWSTDISAYLNSFDVMTLYRLSLIGPFLSGTSLFIAALAALLTLFIYNRRENQHQWDESFRSIYGAFWNDEKIFPKIRTYIVSDHLYEKHLKPTLEDRIRTGKLDNNLNETQNNLLDEIDRFCAILVRARSFGRWPISRRRRQLWKKLLYTDMWTTRNRDALKKYIEMQWEELVP
jgi:hypothetical protein